MEKINYYHKDITIEKFIEIRKSVDWKVPSKEAVKTGLKNTFFLCAQRRMEK